MTLKKLFVAAAAFAGAIVIACGPGRSNPDGGTGGGAGGGTGCVGSCVGGGAGGNAGGGAGGGTGGGGGAGGGAGGGGIVGDGGFVDWTVANLRPSASFGQKVRLNDVVITAVGGLTRGNQGDYAADLWVADQGDLTRGIYVNKFFNDETYYGDGGTYAGYAPQPGDVVTIEGVFSRYSNFLDRNGYRVGVSSGFNTVTPQPTGTRLKMYFEGKSTPPSPVSAPSGFGNAESGATKANPEFAGVYVTIAGPLQLTSTTNPALARYRIVNGTPTLQGYNGFEVTGGVLVNNFYTFGTSDAGQGLTDTGCDYLRAAQDGGAVTFTSISGVWDTYTHSYCQDGGTSSSCFRVSAGNLDGGFTYALWPTRCAQDLPGTVQ